MPSPRLFRELGSENLPHGVCCLVTPVIVSCGVFLSAPVFYRLFIGGFFSERSSWGVGGLRASEVWLSSDIIVSLFSVGIVLVIVMVGRLHHGRHRHVAVTVVITSIVILPPS